MLLGLIGILRIFLMSLLKNLSTFLVFGLEKGAPFFYESNDDF